MAAKKGEKGELLQKDRHVYRRIGHKGADAITPGNTIESFIAAVDAGRRHDRARRAQGP